MLGRHISDFSRRLQEERGGTRVVSSAELGIRNLSSIFAIDSRSFSNDLASSNNDSATIQLEQDILRPLAGTGKAFVYQSANWWSQLKPAGSTIYANRHCLQLYRKRHPERLNGVGIQDVHVKQVPKIIGDVFVHPTACIHHTAVVRSFLRTFIF